MNINYGDEGLVVKYIQAYLNEYYSNTVPINGTYDEVTHTALIRYLNNYNVQDLNTIYKGLEENFPDLFTYFKVYRQVDSIKFISKYAHEDIKNYLQSIDSNLRQYSNTMGWRVTEFTNYNNADVTIYTINIEKQPRDNRFPTREVMCSVNQFNGRFYYGLSFVDGGEGGIDGIVHSSTKYKICIINCEPNQVYTIAHGYTQTTPIYISWSQFSEQQIVRKSRTVQDIKNETVNSGNPIVYTTGNTAKTLIIQVPSVHDLVDDQQIIVRVPVKLGDVNLDGKIDKTDRDLLSEYIKSGVVVKDATLVACSILQRRNVETNELYFNNDDLAELDGYLDGTIPMLGIGYYDQIVEQTTSLESNKILVLNGDYSSEEYNVPFNIYSSSPWMINDKFLNYLLDRTITEYSDTDSIAYLQNLMELYRDNCTFTSIEHNIYKEQINKILNYKTKSVGNYDKQLKDTVRAYQIMKGIPFSLGYLDVETEANIIIELYRQGVNVYEY